MILPQELTFVDTETTGLNSLTGEIIEIGIIKIKNMQVVQTFQSLVKPENPISSFSLQLTGIKASDVAMAPSFTDVLPEILPLLTDGIFVAHNVDFDYAFLQRALAKNNKKLAMQRLCTVKLYEYFYPNAFSHSLGALIERFGFETKNRHRAYDDALVLWEFYQRLLRTHSEGEVIDALQLLIK